MAAPATIKNFMGNLKLKKAYQHVDWTEELVAEYIKCKNDVIYFTEKYLKIVSMDEGLIHFRLHPFQKRMLKAMQKNRFNIITTARQVGKSSTTCAFIIWYTLFHDSKTTALLANKAETAREIFSKIRTMYENMPLWLQQGIVEWNKGSLELENGSRIFTSATTKDSIRGYTVNLLFIDEAAFIDEWEEFSTSVLPTITSGKESKVILVSTPNGLNYYYTIWFHARNRHNGYYPIRVVWSEVPGRDGAWKKSALAILNNDHDKFNQEFCVSGDTIITIRNKITKEIENISIEEFYARQE